MEVINAEAPVLDRETVIRAAQKAYNGKICIDRIEDALREPTLEAAVDVLVLDSSYWDGRYLF